jgi:hypothetical protein
VEPEFAFFSQVDSVLSADVEASCTPVGILYWLAMGVKLVILRLVAMMCGRAVPFRKAGKISFEAVPQSGGRAAGKRSGDDGKASLSAHHVGKPFTPKPMLRFPSRGNCRVFHSLRGRAAFHAGRLESDLDLEFDPAVAGG